MNKAWTDEHGWQTNKTPTTLLLCPNQAFHSFGYEAIENYGSFSQEDQRDYYYFEHFKMELHKSEVRKLICCNGKLARCGAVMVSALACVPQKS